MSVSETEKQKFDRELREQIYLELQEKLKACSNPTYPCTLPRIDNYDYCARHILQDTKGHYQQCTHIFSNGRRCTNAFSIYNLKKDPNMTTMCFEHTREAQLIEMQEDVGKFRAIDSNDALLNNLAQDFQIKQSVKRSLLLESNQEDEIDVVSSNEPTFVAYEQIKSLDTFVEKPQHLQQQQHNKRRILDYASDSSSDDCEFNPNLSNTYAGDEFDCSDNESTDSIDGDLLKHAEIYSQQELVQISQMNLKKLQGYYVDQVHYLHHQLKESRRKYLLALRKERETLCSIHDQAKETPHERLLFKKLKAYNKYHQRHGVEAVLHKKLKEKRAKCDDGYRPPTITKCVHAEGGVRCATRVLPGSKFCRKHILEDKKQKLFRACSVERAGVVCQAVILRTEATCLLHMPLPVTNQFLQKKANENAVQATTPLPSTLPIATEDDTLVNEILKTKNICDEFPNLNQQPQVIVEVLSNHQDPDHVLASNLVYKDHVMPMQATLCPSMK